MHGASVISLSVYSLYSCLVCGVCNCVSLLCPRRYCPVVFTDVRYVWVYMCSHFLVVVTRVYTYCVCPWIGDVALKVCGLVVLFSRQCYIYIVSAPCLSPCSICIYIYTCVRGLTG